MPAGKSAVKEAAEQREAQWYRKLPRNSVQCRLCNRLCSIAEGSAGFCRVRKNTGGKLYSLAYGRTLTLTVDPVEKKPLFHFKPGSRCAGVSTFGCNFRCPFCQNWHIAHNFSEDSFSGVPYTSPEEIVSRTLAMKVEGIAYTYTEPTVFAEYALDTMKLAKEKGLYNVWVSNGYTTREALKDIVPFMDANNIDLKGNDEFYEKQCFKVKRGHVLENIKYLHRKHVHLEITNLIIPNQNDREQDFSELAEFIASVSPDIPLHLSRFFPHWKMGDALPTPHSSLERARAAAKKAGLNYVYIGNVSGEENTLCKKCGSILVKRFGFDSEVVGLKGNKCRRCSAENNFVL